MEIDLQHYCYIPSKKDFFKILSRAWIGINLGIHKGGTNQRKYDYSLAGLVVLSDTIGSRGDVVPHEYTFVDSHDLAAKLEQLITFGRAKIKCMGNENRKLVSDFAEAQEEQLLLFLKHIEQSCR